MLEDANAKACVDRSPTVRDVIGLIMKPPLCFVLAPVPKVYIVCCSEEHKVGKSIMEWHNAHNMIITDSRIEVHMKFNMVLLLDSFVNIIVFVL